MKFGFHPFRCRWTSTVGQVLLSLDAADMRSSQHFLTKAVNLPPFALAMCAAVRSGQTYFFLRARPYRARACSTVNVRSMVPQQRLANGCNAVTFFLPELKANEK